MAATECKILAPVRQGVDVVLVQADVGDLLLGLDVVKNQSFVVTAESIVIDQQRKYVAACHAFIRDLAAKVPFHLERFSRKNLDRWIPLRSRKCPSWI